MVGSEHLGRGIHALMLVEEGAHVTGKSLSGIALLKRGFVRGRRGNQASREVANSGT
jgi:hypothetical protein